MTGAWQKAIGQRLSSIRGEMLRCDFAELLEVSAKTLRRWEAGTTLISTSALSRLAIEGWDLGWLLTGQGSPRAGVGTEEDLNVSIELTDRAMQGHDLPRAAYASVVGQIAKAVSQRVPYDTAMKLADDLVEQRLADQTPGRHSRARSTLR